MAGGRDFGFPTLQKISGPSRRPAKKVPRMKFSVENIISFIFARNAQKVGFHGVKKYCAKKVALTGNLSKICAPISELQKSCPLQISPRP